MKLSRSSRKIGFYVIFIPIAILLVYQVNFQLDRPTPITSPSSAPAAEQVTSINRAALMPNWSTIASWPLGSVESTNAINSTETTGKVTTVDPWQVTTVIVLDDSGSMQGRLEQAKTAIIQAVSQLDPQSRVGVIALNGGQVSGVVSAADAAVLLPEQMRDIFADGGTPLGSRLDAAAEILAVEAEKRRGFGVFRILVTTDGEATDADRLEASVSKILSSTPIELITIGIGIGEGHALNLPGFTSYVSVDGVDGLAGALTAAAAEQTNFQPIDRFEE